MSKFWQYFQELQWPLIFRPGPLSALIKGLALALDDVRQDILWFRSQFNPATCDENFVFPHATSRGIARHSIESDGLFKERTKQAFSWQALGGGQRGLPRILEYLGYSGCDIKNIRDEEPARWAEFKISLDVLKRGLGPDDYALVSWAAQDQKPARSIFAGLETKSTCQGNVFCTGTFALGTVAFLGPEIPGEVETPATVQAGTYIHGITFIKI